jgi:hypothetical protein
VGQVFAPANWRVDASQLDKPFSFQSGQGTPDRFDLGARKRSRGPLAEYIRGDVVKSRKALRAGGLGLQVIEGPPLNPASSPAHGSILSVGLRNSTLSAKPNTYTGTPTLTRKKALLSAVFEKHSVFTLTCLFRGSSRPAYVSFAAGAMTTCSTTVRMTCVRECAWRGPADRQVNDWPPPLNPKLFANLEGV